MLLVYCVIIGFSAFKLTDLIRHIVPWPMSQVTKDVIVLSISVLMGIISYAPSIRLGVFVGLGAGGISSLIHKFNDYLWVLKDGKMLDNRERMAIKERRR